MGTDFLMGIVVVAAIGIVSWPWARGVLRRMQCPRTAAPAPPSALLRWAVGSACVWRRLGVTSVVLLLLWLARRIPVPWVVTDLGDVARYLGNDWQVGVLDLGVQPLLTACLSIQLLAMFCRPIRRWLYAVNDGRRRLGQWTYGLTFCIAAVQAYFVMQSLAANGLLTTTAWSVRLGITCTLIGGAGVWLVGANLIQHYGLGNGVAWIVCTKLGVRIVQQGIGMVQAGNVGLVAALALAAGVAGLLAFWLARRAVPVRAAEHGTTAELAGFLRATFAGTIPVQTAQSLLLLPFTLSYLSDWSWLEAVGAWLNNGWGYYFGCSALTLALTWLYAWLVAQPPTCGTAAAATRAAWHDARRCVLPWTIGFLLVAGLLPHALNDFGNHSFVPHVWLGATGALLLGGLAHDLLRHLHFLRAWSQSARSAWTLHSIASAEADAHTLAAAQHTRGRQTLIEPRAFTWGLPHRTIVDEYRVYVSTTPAG